MDSPPAFIQTVIPDLHLNFGLSCADACISNIVSAYLPQSNGQAERAVQTIKQLLRIVTVLCQQNETNLHWLDALPADDMAIHNAPIASTPFSPYFINCGYNSCLLPDALEPTYTSSHHLNRYLI